MEKQMKRIEQIKNAAWLFDPDDMDANHQIFIDGAEWADNNPQDECDHIIELIHQRSVAFDYGREQSEKVKLAIKAFEQCKIYSECYENLMVTIDDALEELKNGK